MSKFKPGAKITHLHKQIVSKAIRYLQTLIDLQTGALRSDSFLIPNKSVIWKPRPTSSILIKSSSFIFPYNGLTKRAQADRLRCDRKQLICD